MFCKIIYMYVYKPIYTRTHTYIKAYYYTFKIEFEINPVLPLTILYTKF